MRAMLRIQNSQRFRVDSPRVVRVPLVGLLLLLFHNREMMQSHSQLSRLAQAMRREMKTWIVVGKG